MVDCNILVYMCVCLGGGGGGGASTSATLKYAHMICWSSRAKPYISNKLYTKKSGSCCVPVLSNIWFLIVSCGVRWPSQP